MQIQNDKLRKYKCKSNEEMSECGHLSHSHLPHTIFLCNAFCTDLIIREIHFLPKYRNTVWKYEKYKKQAAAISHTPYSCAMQIQFLRNTELLFGNTSKYRLFFFHWYPLKSLKYKKVNLQLSKSSRAIQWGAYF